MSGRKLVISDIHGRYGAFLSVMAAANIDMSQDKLIFVGDYVDRGKNSFEVVRDVRKYEEQGAIVLRGNHEDINILWLQGEWDNENFKDNGGDWTVRSFKDSTDDDGWADIIYWMSHLPYYYTDDEFVYVHAGLMPFTPSFHEVPLERMMVHKRRWYNDITEIPEQDLVWARKEFLLAPKDAILYLSRGKKVIHGHTPMKEVMDDGARINIDIGAGNRKALALTDLTNRIVYIYDWKTDAIRTQPISDVEEKFKQ